MKDKQAELDLIFSRYMRLINSDETGYCKCFTCGRVLFWTEIEAGHWQKRKKLPTRYNLVNVKPQCVECNSIENGEDKIYRENLVKMYGREAVDVLVFLSNNYNRHFLNHRYCRGNNIILYCKKKQVLR